MKPIAAGSRSKIAEPARAPRAPASSAAKKAARPRAGSGAERFVFSPPRIVDRFNLEELTPTAKEQFLIAGRGAWGESTLAAILSCSESEEMIWEHYRVTEVRTGAAAYDAWILADDSGTLFVADSTDETGIGMVQSGFRAERPGVDPKLVEDVAAAYRFARPPFDAEAFEAYWEEFHRKGDEEPGDGVAPATKRTTSGRRTSTKKP